MSIIQDETNIPYSTWLVAIASSGCIGLTSLVPWLFNLTFFERGLDPKAENTRLKMLLSFAIGAILGDVFFHLIPESIHSNSKDNQHISVELHRQVGISVLGGLFLFIIVEMYLSQWSEAQKNDMRKDDEYVPNDLEVLNTDHNNNSIHNDKRPDDMKSKLTVKDLNLPSIKRLVKTETDTLDKNNNSQCSASQILPSCKTITDKSILSGVEKTNTNCQAIDSAGYLSLIANGFDNFTHGLAIGASFLVSTKVGLISTFVIFIHEIPHEICDYAILVNSGFTRWDAVKAQSSVSLFGMFGTITSLYVKSVKSLEAQTSWILPFSAGGFLYVALVNLLPEILDKKTNTRSSFGQAACVIAGVAFMASFAYI